MNRDLPVVAGLFALALWHPATAFPQGLGSLKRVPVPVVPNLDRYVRDPRILVVLGKALFWDMQVGSDGRTACATCHFHAGADHRAQNQLSNPEGAFEPNHRQVPEDFPFHVLSDPRDNRSAVLRDSSQRTGSAGMFPRVFSGLSNTTAELGFDAPDAPQFQISGLHIRQVTTRNTPSVINSIFTVRKFLDGRASDIFTGRTPFGDSDTRANAVAVIEGRLTAEFIRLTNSSLASQAVAPPVNALEMSYAGRTWPVIGRKLLSLRPLATQTIAPDDSVLGPYANPKGRGLDTSYTYLSFIQSAFRPGYWDSAELVDGYTVAEFNFSLFFGLAIQAYESTLIADDSPFDRFAEGKRDALTAQQLAGFLTFQTRAFCQFCHNGPEATNASFTFAASHGPVDTVLTRTTGSLVKVLADSGFFHTGVRPQFEDVGLDALDDFGVPVSIAARRSLRPLGISGAFKVPSLRNVEFTGPYFRNGGQATLEQVVDFYVRGGDFPNAPDLPVEINPFPFEPFERDLLVAFLKSLTDDRVRFERAPFDHPELCVPTGYPNTPAPDPVFPGSAVDRWAAIPAVGRDGNAVPLQTFEELLKGIGSDGSRAHTLTDACHIQ
jgi:cytochrome c peroxidase